jgi:potassium/chloride transporter 9
VKRRRKKEKINFITKVRKFLLRLNPREQQHGKLWRPSVLLFVSKSSSPLLQACNYLKRGGIYVVGTVIVSQHLDDVSRKQLQQTEESWLDAVADAKVKGF